MQQQIKMVKKLYLKSVLNLQIAKTINEINNTRVDNAEDIDVVMLIYKLIE